jgi:hypothetical protein
MCKKEKNEFLGMLSSTMAREPRGLGWSHVTALRVQTNQKVPQCWHTDRVAREKPATLRSALHPGVRERVCHPISIEERAQTCSSNSANTRRATD